ERFFTLSLNMLCVAGFGGYFERLNPSWERTLGFTSAELMAKPFLEFIHPEDRQATIAEGKKLTSGARTVAFENRYLSKDGSYRSFLWAAAPSLEQGLIYGAARDITERKRAEQEIKELNVSLERR